MISKTVEAFNQSGNSPPKEPVMSRVPPSDNRLVSSTEEPAKTFPVRAVAVAAYLVTLGYELAVAPDPRDTSIVIWLAPVAASPAADKYATIWRALRQDQDRRENQLAAAARPYSEAPQRPSKAPQR